MFLSKSRGGYYYIWYTDDRGKRRKVSTRCKLKTDALKALTDFKALTARKGSSIMLAQFVEQFLRYAEATYSLATVEMYRRTLGYFLAHASDRLLKSITPKHIDEYKTWRVGKIKPVSANIEVRTIKAALNTARRWKLLEANPCDQVRPLPIPEETPVYFKPGDFQTLISTIKESWSKEVVMFAVLTGMRRGEILNLKWDQVDLPNRLVHVQSTAEFNTKKGKRRIIPLHESALYILIARQGRTAAPYVFTLNGRKILDEWLTHLFKRYVRQTKLGDGRLHFHSLRHYAELGINVTHMEPWLQMPAFPCTSSRRKWDIRPSKQRKCTWESINRLWQQRQRRSQSNNL
jgi:integrase